METRKQAILAALDKFTRQRAGLEFGNYGDVASYRSEQRSITKDLHHYRELERYVMLRDSITADMLLEAARRAYSGRLEIVEPNTPSKYNPCLKSSIVRIEYCTGQYFPTEYRRAACAVLSAAIWAWWREHCMPKPAGTITLTRGKGEPWQYTSEHDAYVRGKVRMSAGDWLRSNARREFSRGVAVRWFD